MIRRVRVKGPGVKLANKWCYIGDEATVDEQEFEKNKEYVDVIEEIEEPKTEPENPINPEGEQNDGTDINDGTNDEGENSGENKNETSEDEELEADSYFELAKIKLMKGEKETAIKYANIAIDIESKRISEKIKKEPLFIPIMAKISIPFNLEEKEELGKMTKQELMAKEHLENTTDITMNMGYVNLKKKKEKSVENAIQKERE